MFDLAYIRPRRERCAPRTSADDDARPAFPVAVRLDVGHLHRAAVVRQGDGEIRR